MGVKTNAFNIERVNNRILGINGMAHRRKKLRISDRPNTVKSKACIKRDMRVQRLRIAFRDLLHWVE
jgi:hypothetical protein